MALGYSLDRSDVPDRLLARHGGALLRVALESIGHGLDHGAALGIEPARYAPALRAERASFVTVKVEGALRGCIGQSRPCKPLVADVAKNAYAAAFTDDRFAAITAADVDDIDVKVSVLGDLEPVRFSSESELLALLRPGIDGVVLECDDQRALFLPDVWEMLPEPRDFLAQLKVKAGLEADYWSPRMTAERFVTASTSLSAPSIEM